MPNKIFPSPGRPTFSFRNCENHTVKILSTWAAPPENPQAFEETDDEATTGNRRVKYKYLCKACGTEHWISKLAMKQPRTCQTCQAVLSFTAGTSGDAFTVAPENLGKGPVTLFYLDNAIALVPGAKTDAIQTLANAQPRFAATWLEGPKLAFTFSEIDVLRRNTIIRSETLSPPGTRNAVSPSEAVKPPALPTSSTDEENAPKTLAGTLPSLSHTAYKGPPPSPSNIHSLSQRDIDKSDPDNLIHQEGWYDSLAKAAEMFGLLPPSPAFNQGWLVRNDTLALIKAGGLYDDKLEDITYVQEGVARYAADATSGEVSPGWTYLYRSNYTGADTFF